MHRIPLHLSTISTNWNRTLPEYVLFERTLCQSNFDATMAFMNVLDKEADFFKKQGYGMAEDLFYKAQDYVNFESPTIYKEGKFLLQSIILRTPKDSHILSSALKFRGNLFFYDCAFEFAANDYEMYLEVQRYKKSPPVETCQVIGNLIVCMYIKREVGKAKQYLTLYKKKKAKLPAEVFWQDFFVQTESRIKNFMKELYDFETQVPKILDNADCNMEKNVTESILNTSFNFEVYATADIQPKEVVFVENPLLKFLNAPLLRCEICFRLTDEQMYTCFECRYKSYCSLACLDKDKSLHKDECFGYKQLTLLILDAVGIYRVFTRIAKYLKELIYKNDEFSKKKTAKELWISIMRHAINDAKLKRKDCYLSFITITPNYRSLKYGQYTTLVATAFRLAVFIDSKTDLIDECFKLLNASPKQKLLLVGSLLMRIHCNILLNTYDFEIKSDMNLAELEAKAEESTFDVIKDKSKGPESIDDLNNHFKIDMDKDIWKRSSEILQSAKCKVTEDDLLTTHSSNLCQPINRILSIYKDNISSLALYPDQLNAIIYGPRTGQPITQKAASEMCAILGGMSDASLCYFLKRFARLFHLHYAEYFPQMCKVQKNQVLSLFSTKLSQYKHSCNPNVEIILLDNGVIVGKTLRYIKKGEQLFTSNKAHRLLHVRTDRQEFLKHCNIKCQCVYCDFNYLDDEVNMRQSIYCENCTDVEITPNDGKCPQCHTEYRNMLMKYDTTLSIFENKWSNMVNSGRKSDDGDRELFILEYIMHAHSEKYLPPHNEHRARFDIRHARYLVLTNSVQLSYNLIMQIRDRINGSCTEDFIWFTDYADLLYVIKIILYLNVKVGVDILTPKMLMELCDLGLYIVKGKINMINFFEIFDWQSPYVLKDLSLLLNWKDKIVCHKVWGLAEILKKNKK